MRLLFLLPLLWTVSVCCQKHVPLEKPVCIDPSFEKTVTKYLDFSVPVISVDQLHDNLDDYTLLDAREWAEFKTSHIANAKFIGYDTFSESNLKGISKDAKIVVYCSIGYRSEKIGEKLMKLGYKNVQNLYGSIFEWVNNDYPVVNMTGQPTQKLHTYDKKWGKHVDEQKCEKVF